MIDNWVSGLFAGHCWGCDERLALGLLGPWCPGCVVGVQAAPVSTPLVGDLRVRSLWVYAGAVAHGIAGAKSSGRWPGLAGVAPTWRALVEAAAPRSRPTLVAVPPHLGRLRDRGWHLPDLLAAQCRGVRVWRPVVRCDGAEPRRQDRTATPRFAWAAHGKAATMPGSVVLVDDVVTTGATLQALADVLRQRGMTVTTAVCLADARPEVVAQVVAEAVAEPVQGA